MVWFVLLFYFGVYCLGVVGCCVRLLFVVSVLIACCLVFCCFVWLFALFGIGVGYCVFVYLDCCCLWCWLFMLL